LKFISIFNPLKGLKLIILWGFEDLITLTILKSETTIQDGFYKLRLLKYFQTQILRLMHIP